MMNKLCNRLEFEGIEYKRFDVNGLDLIYIHHGAFGHPSGLKIRRGEFRPDFRVSYHGDGEYYYTRVCGAIKVLTLDEIIETAKTWGIER